MLYISNLDRFDSAMSEVANLMEKNKSKYDFLPKDVKSVIIHDNTVIVNLNDGRKGISKCGHKDEFDCFCGFTIAYYKAKNSKSFKLKEVLNNCLQSANEKGYDKAILKNY